MSLQYIVLGFLNEEPSSGYDLNKRIQESVWHFWTSEQSQIYRALYKLHDQDYVEFEVVVQQDVPNKKVYSLTESGEEALREWLNEDVDDSEPNQSWIGQLFFSSGISNDRRKEILQNRLDDREERLKALNEKHEFLEKVVDAELDKIRVLTLEARIHQIKAEIEWLGQTIQSL